MADTKGVIMFNRGDKIVVRAIVALYSIRKHYDGPITFYVEDPYPHEFDEVLKYFKCDIVHNETRHDFKTLVRKNSLFENPPYDRTLWIDADVIVVGKIDEMFNYLDEKDVDFCIPCFAGWRSTGNHITKRIKRFEGIAEDKYLQEALKEHPAVNTGILSFKKSEKWSEFVRYWTNLAQKGSEHHVFIPDETAAQILYPSMSEWGLKYFIAPTDFNVSVLHDHGQSKDPRIYHFHGDKNVLDVPTCDFWKKEFKEMCDSNIANINAFLKYADKRLEKYLRGENPLLNKPNDPNTPDTTIVSACDENYVDILRITFANWREYKNIDAYPVIIFVHGIPIEDARLDFLKLPNVTIVPWKMENAENHREEMLSAFVFGTAENVKTDYWLKLDADSYATNNTPFIADEMKVFAFCGHKWGYSRPDHIRKLDEWAKGHWKKKLKNAKPMIEEGTINGNRFFHNTKRTISFIQLHKTQFTKFCVKLLRERKLPAPTQDTFFFYVANRFDPKSVGIMNFKKKFGFTQGKGKLGAEYIRKKVMEVENKQIVEEKDSEEIEEAETKSNAFSAVVPKIEVVFEPIQKLPPQSPNKTLIEIPDYAKISVLTEETIKIDPNKVVSQIFGRKINDGLIVEIVER